MQAPAVDASLITSRPDHIALGIAYAALAHLAVGGIFVLLYVFEALFQEFALVQQLGRIAIAAAGIWLLTLGLSQCVYLLPLAIYFHYTQRPRAVIGVLICVAIVFVLCVIWISVLVFGFNSSFVG